MSATGRPASRSTSISRAAWTPLPREPSAVLEKIGELAGAHLARLDAGSGRVPSETGEPLIDRRVKTGVVRDHHDFAVQIVGFDVSGTALQGLPGRSTDEGRDARDWPHGEAGCARRGLLAPR